MVIVAEGNLSIRTMHDDAAYYRWLPWTDDEHELDIRADPATFGLDIHIGEPDLIDRGIGSRAVDLLCTHLEDVEGASWVALTTDVTNHRAQRVRKGGLREGA